MSRNLSAVVALFLMMITLNETAAAQTNDTGDLHLPEFIAHRGASWLAPENTMASIQLAWEMDVDAVEVDIYLTADDEIVVFHDQNTARIAGRDAQIEDQTLEELQELDVGSWKGDQWEGERMITLDEALATIPRGKRMFIDVKSDTRIVRPMLEAFDRTGHQPHQMVVIAFSYELSAKTKRLRPRTPVYWLVSFNPDNETDEWSPSMDEVVERTVEAGLDGVNLNFRGPAQEREEIRKIRDAGLGYYIWTVNEVEDAQLALELGVDGITTDRPAWIKKNLLSTNGWRLLRKP